MKKKRTILLALFLGAIAILMSTWLRVPEFVTQKSANLERVIIFLYPTNIFIDLNNIRDTITVPIIERAEMERLHNLVKITKRDTLNRWPRHAESVQWDPKFLILFEYRDGKTDKVFATERAGNICSLLKTKGGSGDPGYISGNNEAIWEYILQFE